MNKYKLTKFFLYLFITLSITNTIEWLYVVKIISQYGKIIVVSIGTMFFIFFAIKDKVLKLSNLIYLTLFLSLLLIFAMIFLYDNNISFYDCYFKTLMYTIYIIYIFLTVNNLMLYYSRYFSASYAKELTLIDIAKIFQKVILLNIVIWTSVAIMLHQSLYDIDPTGNRSGFAAFTGDRMAFGLILATLYLSTFILLLKEQNIFNKIIFLLSFLLTIYSDARTALLIEVIFIIMFFAYKKIKYLEFYILILFLFLIYIIVNYLDITDLEQYSSGRVFIWLIVLKEKVNDFWYGDGLFNFNNYILLKYRYLSYYFQRIDYLNFHSSYIEIFAAGGIIALFFYIMFLYKTYIKANRLNKSIIFAISLGAFLEGYITQPAIVISSFFWIILMLSNINNNVKCIK